MENQDAANTVKKSRLKSIVLFLVKISLAFGIIIWLVGSKKEDFLSAIKDFNILWLIPVVSIYLLHLIVGAWRWKLLLDVQGIHIPFLASFSMIMKGFFFSLVIPGGALGGDLARASLIASKAPKGTRFEGTFSILMDRFIGMIALFSLAVVVIVFSFPILREVKGLMELAVYAIISGCFAGLFAALCIFYIHKLEKISLIAKLIKIADHYSKGMVSRLTDALDSYRTSFKTVLLAVVVSIFFIHLAMCVIVFCISSGLSEEAVSFQTVIIAVTIGNTAGLLPITMSGVGTRDLFIITLLTAGGFPKGIATAAAIIYTAVILSFNLLGGLFFIFGSNAEKGFSAKKENLMENEAS